MEHNADGCECPECGHFEPAETVADILSEQTPTDKISAWAALARAALEKIP